MMLALTIRQPWAALVALGLKPIEIRIWPGLPHIRTPQPVMIHAAKTYHQDGEYWLSNRFPSIWDQVPPELRAVRGSLIAQATFDHVIEYTDAFKFDSDQHLHYNPPHRLVWECRAHTNRPARLLGFYFTDVHLISPILVQGALNFWTYQEGRAHWGKEPDADTQSLASPALGGGEDPGVRGTCRSPEDGD